MEIINLKSATSPAENNSQTLQITDIKQAVKNENRVNIFVNKKYEFSLDIAQLVEFKLKIGTILTIEDLEKYKKASLIGKTYQRLLEWVLTRPRSVKEAKDYLNRRAYNQGRTRATRNTSFVSNYDDKMTSPANIRTRAARNASFWGHPQLQKGRDDEEKLFSQRSKTWASAPERSRETAFCFTAC